MAKRWQYPSRVEPVLVPAGPPPVLVSAWHPTAELPPRRKSNLSYTYPFAWEPDRQPVPPASQWIAALPVPVRTRPRIPNELIYFDPLPIPNPPPPVLVSSWLPVPEVPQRPKVNFAYTYPCAAAPDRQPVPVVSKWL